ncbi:MAG: AMP-binding protein [Symploca sp. SIO2G7]|nr:AMP-binding protein [Symploca sp. SIO2G7]
MSVSQTNSSSSKEAPASTSVNESQQPGAGQTIKAIENIDEQLLAAALLTHPSVDDCAVRLKETQASEQELVAYVVLAGQFSPERLQSYLPSALPQVVLPKVNFVPVSQLPLTTEGQIDEQALARLPLIDSDLVKRWEEQIHSLPEIEQAAVVVQELTDNIPPLHLSDLLPNWKTTSRISPQTKVTPQVLPTDLEAQSESQSFSISEGELLKKEADAPKNLSQALRRTVQRSPDKGITYIQKDGSNTVQLYPALLEQAERILTGLRALGLKPQDKVIFQFDSNQDYIPAFWGCILGGLVPVPVATAPVYEPSNSVVKKLHNTWQTLEQPIVFTNNSLAPKLRALSGQLNLENFQIETVEELRSCDRDQNWYDSQPDDLAVLLFTSGSTGVPKGVMLTNGNIISNVAASAQINGFSRDDTSLNWLHLDHVGSLVRCSIRDIYVGSQQIHAPSSLVLENPLKLLDWIEQYRVTFAWAPNFALGLINDRAEIIQQQHWDLSSLRSMLSVAEAIVPKTAKRFTQLLAPHGFSAELMHSAWGMSETCAAVTFSHRYLLALPSDDYPYVEVGGPTPGFQMRIVDNKDQVIPEDTVGRLQIKGPMITVGYYQNSQLNQDTFTEDGWFKTGDLGLLHQGRLTITGREKDLIIINGLNHYSYEIEAVVEEVEGVEVSYTAACALRQPGSDTDQLLIFFHTPFSEDDRLVEVLKEIRSNIVREVGISPTYLIPVEKETIPKTSIGKIQRLQLRKQFEAGEFDATAKHVDILLGNDNTLPDWFYRKNWRHKEALSLESQPRTGLSLVFLDSLGLGEFLCAELGKYNQPCVGVEIGSNFAKLADNRYRINPNHPDDYQQLLLSVAEENLFITQILHLWNYQEYAGEISSLEALEEAQEKGVYGLLFLVQALAQIQNSETPVRLQIIASHSQPTSSEDEIAYERTPILGLVKTIPQEMPWLDCRHLDLSTGKLSVNAAQVLREIQVIPREQEVAYRNGQRLVPRLEKVNLRQKQKREMPFKHGGMYLLSGGLGEIGVEIAKYLLQHYGARLLLVGRTPLPPRETWETYINQENGLSRRIKAYLELEQLGEVIYEVVDICNLVQLKQAVEHSSNRWQSQLDGIIHLARVTQEHLLIEETRESLAAMLSPKVSGAWALHQLIKNQPNAVFVNFSSVSSVFGTYRMGGYAAANRFLDCFSHYQRYKKSLQSYCFAWSIWEEVGADRSYQMRDLSQARGYYTIPSRQGLSSFFGGLNHDHGYMIVGLDGSNLYMRRYTSSRMRAS